MNKSESIRHNASLIRAQIRGKSKADRWNVYACLMLGMLAPIVAVSRIWRDGEVAFKVDTSLTWAQARNR